MAVTALETLGRCPLQFFFKHVLGVPEPEEPRGPFLASRARIGKRVHATLKSVYEALRAEGLLAGTPEMRARANELLRQAWPRTADPEDRARSELAPLLEEIDTSLRLDALAAFIVADLGRLRGDGLVPIAFERDREGVIDLPGGRRLELHARFDRIAEGSDRRVVGDYKTGSSLKTRVDIGEMVKGNKLQVPLYALLGEAEVELLGVGEHGSSDAGEDARFARFPGFPTPEAREGFLETVGVLLALDEAGAYPMRPERHCRWCAYRSACRRTHAPTRFREDGASDATGERRIRSKTVGKPRFADLASAEDA